MSNIESSSTESVPVAGEKRPASPTPSPAEAKRARKEKRETEAIERIRTEDVPRAAAMIQQLAADHDKEFLAKLAVFLASGIQAIGEGSAMDEICDILIGVALPKGAPAPVRVHEEEFKSMKKALDVIKNGKNVHPATVLAVGTDLNTLGFETGDEKNDFFSLWNVAGEEHDDE